MRIFFFGINQLHSRFMWYEGSHIRKLLLHEALQGDEVDFQLRDEGFKGHTQSFIFAYAKLYSVYIYSFACAKLYSFAYAKLGVCH